MSNVVLSVVKALEAKGLEVERKTVVKNNSPYEALSVSKSRCLAAPSIPIRFIEDQYDRGLTVEKIAEQIITMAGEEYCGIVRDKALEITNDFEGVKDVVLPVLVKGGNNPLLDNLVYTTICDMAIIYIIPIEESARGLVHIKITNEYLETLGVTKMFLHECAMANLNRSIYNGKWECMNLDFLVEQLKAQMGIDMPTAAPSAPAMFVITNPLRVNGANVLLSEKFRETVSSLGGDVWVIPSSVHEVIILPVDDSVPVVDIVTMINEVNAGMPPEDVLSDTLYRYSVEDGLRVEICAGTEVVA